MIQYAKLHQKDVISVIIPNFFSSPTVYSYLRLSVVRFQFMSGLVLFATHFGLTTDGSLFWRSAKPGTSVVEVPGQELARPL